MSANDPPLPVAAAPESSLPIRELRPWHWLAVMFVCLAAQVAVALVWAIVTMIPAIATHAKPEKPVPGPAMLLVLQSLDFALAMLGAWYFACHRLGLSFREGLDARRPARMLALAAVGAGVLCIAAKTIALAIDPSGPPEMLMKMIDTPAGFYSFALLGLVSPVFEEIYYRGFMYRALENGIGTGAAATIVTFWFVALHVPQYWPSLGAITSILVLSLVTTILRMRTGSIIPGMIAHGVYNVFVIGAAVLARAS